LPIRKYNKTIPLISFSMIYIHGSLYLYRPGRHQKTHRKVLKSCSVLSVWMLIICFCLQQAAAGSFEPLPDSVF